MSNRSTYNSKLLRAGPGAPAARDGVIGTVNPYWVQQATSRKRLESRAKRQAASRKRREGGPASNKQQAEKR